MPRRRRRFVCARTLAHGSARRRTGGTANTHAQPRDPVTAFVAARRRRARIRGRIAQLAAGAGPDDAGPFACGPLRQRQDRTGPRVAARGAQGAIVQRADADHARTARPITARSRPQPPFQRLHPALARRVLVPRAALDLARRLAGRTASSLEPVATERLPIPIAAHVEPRSAPVAGCAAPRRTSVAGPLRRLPPEPRRRRRRCCQPPVTLARRATVVGAGEEPARRTMTRRCRRSRRRRK